MAAPASASRILSSPFPTEEAHQNSYRMRIDPHGGRSKRCDDVYLDVKMRRAVSECHALKMKQRRFIKWIFAAGTLGIVLMWVNTLARTSITTATPISSTLSAPNTDDATDNAKEASGSGECSTARMLHWAQQRGAALRNIDVYHFATGRGVRAVREVSAGSVVVSVPWAHVITIEHLANSSHAIGLLARKYARNLPQMDYLALFLLYESRDALSEWQPWLCMLPANYSSPLLWGEEELRRRASPELQASTRSLARSLRLKFERKILPLLARAQLFAEGGLTYDSYLKAMIAVRSRVFGVFWNGRKLKVLAPVIDMLNHRQHAKSAMVLETESELKYSKYPSQAAPQPAPQYTFALIAGQNFSKGDQVEIEYSRSCNDRLMLVYGFHLGAQNHKKECHSVLQSIIDELDEEE